MSKGWNPPPVGSQERKKMPASAFLDPAHRKYPFKSKNSKGNWVVNKEGLKSAQVLSGMLGHDKIHASAKRKLGKITKTK